MKILLTNHILGGLTGSETWVKTMKEELESLGHQITTSTGDNVEDIYDLAIINHNVCLNKVKHLSCKKIFTSHGIIPPLEQPIDGADIYVSVSEEVQANLKSKGFDSVIIRNGIDVDKYKCINPINNEIKNVLFSSNYGSGCEHKIKQACRELGLTFKKIGGIDSTPDVVGEINKVDLVIGLGRTAYEAMSCERNVIIFDYNGADGFATPETLKEYRYNNCSGRCKKKQLTVEDIKELFNQYDKKLGKQLREYIIENNNIKNVVDKYLEL